MQNFIQNATHLILGTNSSYKGCSTTNYCIESSEALLISGS